MQDSNFFLSEGDLGRLMRELEEFEHFYPCFQTMIKKA